MKKIILIVISLTTLISAYAQKKIKTLEISDTVTNAAVDRPGELYVITQHGQLQKFNENGELIILYKNQKSPTLFDPRDGSKLFAYYRDTQHYEFLNPSFEITSSYKIDSAFAIKPWLICPSGEYKLWILDGADHSLKKINVKESEVEIEVMIDATLINDAKAFTKMREYQSFVFLLNPAKGIYIFNSIGKHIKTIEVPGLKNFNFLGEELYYMQNGKVKFFDLFSAEMREISFTPITGEILLTDQRLFAINPRAIEIYEFRP